MIKLYNKQKGAGKLTLLVFGVIAFVLLYCAYNIMPFYYYYYELQNQFESHAQAAQMYTDKELRSKLMYHIEHVQIPLKKPEDLKIDRSNGVITISLKYREIFYITYQGKDYDLWVFDFNPKATADVK